MWNQVESLFFAALDRPASDRSRFLSALKGVPAGVRGEVERLLRLSETTDRFLEPPELPASPGEGGRDLSGHCWIGKQLGAFRVVSLIAHGGMGSVWLAERADGLFQQRVAVKTLALGPMSEFRRGYFDRERRVLAKLEHPYITRLIDGGASDDGTPFLVTELADGVAIDTYCDERSICVSNRLRLFLEVCDAVRFAHHHLVVHADLKPRNILVGSNGSPKLLDFGVANLIADDPGIDMTESSRYAIRAMTPRYASPECRRGGHATIASDVYSLGIVLCELLAGAQGSSNQVHRPGTANPNMGGDSPARSSDSRAFSEATTGLDPVLRHRRWRRLSDLDAIVSKATANDPALRYSSVEHLADDVRNYLSQRPVVARRPTAGYRFRKFIQRNRAASLLAVLVALALFAGVIGTASGLRRAQRQRDVALRATEFIETLLSSTNPYQTGVEPSVLDVLANASSRIEEELTSEPEVEAEVRFSIARTYGGLWLWAEARPHVERAMELTRRLKHVSDAELAERLHLYGSVLAWNHDGRAESVQREALGMMERLHGPRHPVVAYAKVHLAFAMWFTPQGGGNWVDAETLFRDAISVLRDHRDTHPYQLAMATYSLSAMLSTKGDRESDGYALAEESIALFRQSGERPDRHFAEALRHYAYTLRQQGRWREEAAAMEEYLARTPVSFAVDAVALSVRWRLHQIFVSVKEREKADHWFRECILAECRARAASSRIGQAETWELLTARVGASNDSRLLTSALQAVVMELGKGLCDDDLPLIQRIAHHARTRCDDGDETLVRGLVDCAKSFAGEETRAESITASVLEGAYGVCLLRADRVEEAKLLLISSVVRVRGRLSQDDPLLRSAIDRMVRLYERTGEFSKAEAYRRMISPRQ